MKKTVQNELNESENLRDESYMELTVLMRHYVWGLKAEFDMLDNKKMLLATDTTTGHEQYLLLAQIDDEESKIKYTIDCYDGVLKAIERLKERG